MDFKPEAKKLFGIIDEISDESLRNKLVSQLAVILDSSCGYWKPIEEMTSIEADRDHFILAEISEGDRWRWCEAFKGQSMFGKTRWCSWRTRRPLDWTPTHYCIPMNP